MHRCFYSFYFSDLLLQQYFFIHSSSNIELLLNALYLNSDAPKCYSQATFTHSHPQATEGVNPKAFFMSPKYWRYRMSSSGNEFTTIFKHGYVFPLTRNFRLQNTTEKKKISSLLQTSAQYTTHLILAQDPGRSLDFSSWEKRKDYNLWGNFRF